MDHQYHEPGAPDANGFIHDPRESDVLCGRGGAALRHPGNQTYRRLVNLNKGLYSTCLKTEKLKISRSIVAAIREQQGRFLEKDSEKDAWLDIGDKKAVEKTSQALREGQPKLRQKIAEMGAAAATANPYELASLAQGGGGGGSAGGANDMMSPPQSMQDQLLAQQQQRQQQQRQQQQQQQAVAAVQMQQQQQLQEQQYRQQMLERQQQQQQELMQQRHSSEGSYANNSAQNIGNTFLNGSNHSMGSRSRAPQDLQPPSPMTSTAANRQADLHADMLQRLTLHDLQTVAAATGDNNHNANNLSLEQQRHMEQRNRLRPSLTNTRASLVRDLGMPLDSNLSLMSDFSAYGGNASGLSGMHQQPMTPSSMQGAAMGGGGFGSGNALQGDSLGMMSVDNNSFKRALMSMPMGSIHTINTLASDLDISSMHSATGMPYAAAGGGGGNNSQAALAAATAAAVNNSGATGSNRNFDRRRLFAKMKYSRPSQQQQQCSGNMAGGCAPSQLSHMTDDLPDFHMMESNMSLYSNMSNMTGGVDSKLPAATATTNSTSTASNYHPNQYSSHHHHGDHNSHAAMPSPTKVIVETAKVVDRSSQQQQHRNSVPFGDVMSAGSRHSIMSGLSRISDTSLDQSIFSDLSKKIGNVSTRSMAMSEVSAFDITEGDNDDETDDFATGRAKIEGGPVG